MKYSLKYSLKRLLLICALSLNACLLLAGEGMWIPLLLQSLNEEEMTGMGMKMSAEDIYSVNEGSLKDAIVHFNGSCTGAVISDKGLMLTNHHCGYRSIQAQSTMEHNYLRDGFWAKSLAEELPAQGVYARFINRIEDITSQAFKDITDEMTPSERQSGIDRNLNEVRISCIKEPWQEVMIKPFFEGNQYFLFVTETYNDVRYVGSPPESIGKFGADTDNWVWPRHCGDFSVFRIYAGPDNKPAEYSPDNKPFKPRHFLPVSLDGIDEGDFTLVYGFPATTEHYLPSFALEQTVEVINPAKVAVRDISLGIMDKYMRSDEAIRLAYASKYNDIANYWKKYIGQIEGVRKTNAIAIKKQEEDKFEDIIQHKRKLSTAYGEILPKLEILYRDLSDVARNRAIVEEILGGRNIELFRLALYADRLRQSFINNGESGFETGREKVLPVITKYFRDYRVNIDRELFTAVVAHAAEKMDTRFLPDTLTTFKTQNEVLEWCQMVFNLSQLHDQEKFMHAIEQGGESFNAWLEKDPAYALYLSFKDIYSNTLTPYHSTLYSQIQPLQKEYVNALMMVYPKQRFWPDGNSTLRVTYGKVEGFSPRDGIRYETQTYLEGVMEKYKPGDYEFDVPERLIKLYQDKDYGPYGENGKMPVAFLGSNHTTNGNSGSPAIDAYGNLIGLNFDRAWEGTMSDLYYDPSICRNIMVDARYILFIIDKYGGAPNLVSEMQLTHPKSN